MILNDIFKLYLWSLKVSREPAPDRGRGRTRSQTVKKLAHSSGKNKKKETLLLSQSGNLISVLPTATLRYPPSLLIVTHTIVIFHLFLFIQKPPRQLVRRARQRAGRSRKTFFVFLTIFSFFNWKKSPKFENFIFRRIQTLIIFLKILEKCRSREISIPHQFWCALPRLMWWNDAERCIQTLLLIAKSLFENPSARPGGRWAVARR